MCKNLSWPIHEQVRIFNPEVLSPPFSLHSQNRGNCTEISSSIDLSISLELSCVHSSVLLWFPKLCSPIYKLYQGQDHSLHLNTPQQATKTAPAPCLSLSSLYPLTVSQPRLWQRGEAPREGTCLHNSDGDHEPGWGAAGVAVIVPLAVDLPRERLVGHVPDQPLR